MFVHNTPIFVLDFILVLNKCILLQVLILYLALYSFLVLKVVKLTDREIRWVPAVLEAAACWAGGCCLGWKLLPAGLEAAALAGSCCLQGWKLLPAELEAAVLAGSCCLHRQVFSRQKLTQGCVKLFSTVSGTDRQPLRNKLSGHPRFCFIFKMAAKIKDGR